jgi:hypothetical protein
MARQSAQDLLWTQIELCLLAWEAVRSDPEYIKDWKKNKKYIDWYKQNPSATLEDPKLRWLWKLGQKWDFFVGRIPENPRTHIPFIPRDRFHQCTERCKKITSIPKRPSTRCKERYLAYISLYCPFAPKDGIAVLLACPYAALIEVGEKFPPHALAAYEFDKQEYNKPDRLVLWCPRGVWRKSLVSQVSYYLDSRLEAAIESGVRDPRQVRKQDLVRTHWIPEFVIFSIDLLGSKRRIWSKVKKELARLPRRPFEDILPAVKRGLEYYRMKHLQKKSDEAICIKVLGKEVWEHHRELRKFQDS